MMQKYLAFFLVFIAFHQINAQGDLAFYCDVMNNAYEPAHRIKAANEFESLFMQALKKDESFTNDFKELKWVSIKTPSDSTFRLITWQLKGENDNHTYKGVIQKQDNKLFTLNDQSSKMPEAEYEIHDPSYWYGALYYNMLEKEFAGKKHYFLFGFNGVNNDIQIKVIDELHFENGNPVFGDESFKIVEDDNRVDFKNRIVIDYSDKANVNSNYNGSMDLIVHDFVTPRMGISGTGRPVKIPDGTYVGFKWEDGSWLRIDKIEHQISTPESIYYQPKPKDDRDLFGKQTKKN